jgi:hypothetical protein
VWNVERGKKQYCGRGKLKNIEDFVEGVTTLNDAVYRAVEEVRKDRKISNAELMCVLSGLLCALAADCGMDHDDFLDSLSINFLATSTDIGVDRDTIH